MFSLLPRSPLESSHHPVYGALQTLLRPIKFFRRVRWGLHGAPLTANPPRRTPPSLLPSADVILQPPHYLEDPDLCPHLDPRTPVAPACCPASLPIPVTWSSWQDSRPLCSVVACQPGLPLLPTQLRRPHHSQAAHLTTCSHSVQPGSLLSRPPPLCVTQHMLSNLKSYSASAPRTSASPCPLRASTQASPSSHIHPIIRGRTQQATPSTNLRAPTPTLCQARAPPCGPPTPPIAPLSALQSFPLYLSFSLNRNMSYFSHLKQE